MSGNNNVPSDTPDVPHTEIPAQIPDPTGASYEAKYILNTRLVAVDGSDVPIVNRRFKNTAPADKVPRFEVLPKENTFNSEKEDYWLFSVHLHDAEMEFAIGGKSPVYATSHPNWRTMSQEKGKQVTLYYKSYRSWDGTTSSVHVFADFELDWNRYVAIRAPKMSNPAITIKGNGYYASVSWVGLFVQSGVDAKNDFVAVKTTCRLLPKYSKRIETANWYHEDCGADVTNRTITLFPKQLYGSIGTNQRLYDQFVTEDPTNQVGEKHLAMVKSKLANGGATNLTDQGLSYTWNSDRATNIKGTKDYHIDMQGSDKSHSGFNYTTGHALQMPTVDGWKFLLDTFRSVNKLVSKVISMDFLGIVEDVLKNFTPAGAGPNEAGLITELVNAARLGMEINDKLKKVNTTEVTHLVNLPEIPDVDFGYD